MFANVKGMVSLPIKSNDLSKITNDNLKKYSMNKNENGNELYPVLADCMGDLQA